MHRFPHLPNGPAASARSAWPLALAVALAAATAGPAAAQVTPASAPPPAAQAGSPEAPSSGGARAAEHTGDAKDAGATPTVEDPAHPRGELGFGDLPIPERLEDEEARSDGAGETHEILTGERVLADERYWVEERIGNYLSSKPLLDLRTLLHGRWSTLPRSPELADVFTDDALVAPLAPPGYADEEVTLGVVRRVWTGYREAGAERLTSAEEWERALGRFHAESARVRWALVKPALIELTDFGARVKVKWRLNRELPGGGIQHDHGYWTSEWLRTGEEAWRCRRLEPLKDCYTLLSEAPHFVDSTGEALAGTALDPRLPTRKSGGQQRGVALADLDDDGDLDLVVTISNRVLYNRGDGTFEDRSAEVLVGGHGEGRGRGFGGVLVADFDRDGAQDIVMAAKRRPMTLYLQRDGAFHPKTIAASHANNIPASLAAHDVDGDGWLDLFVCGYGPFINPGPNDFTNARNGRPNQMLRGRPDGEFEDVTQAWGLDAEGTRWTFVGAFGDPDADGDFDLYAANDFGPNVLYRRVEGEGVRFRAEIEDPEEIDSGFSMSATWADLDGDLDLDLYVSNMSSTAANRVRQQPGNPNEAELGIDLDDVRRRMSKGNTIVLNQDGAFVEAGAEHGAKGASWAWGTALFDYDADGDLDIHCLNGFWTKGLDDGRDL